ncbi:MAG: transporter substrate-binding protein [Verrucomicrobia bacterium]|jgi:peptide/nickel transport system permease protein|nr:transporter substrate-binding protein [Verrucomicrobiota bacterium]
MWQYIAKRLLHLIPILIGVSLLSFMLMWAAPGSFYDQLRQNPQISPEQIKEMEAKRHLDKPFYVAYSYWLINAFKGDLGYSLAYKMQAGELIQTRLWNTFILSFFSMALAWIVAIPLGIWAAVKKDSFVDRACSTIAFVGLSIPEVLLALLALMLAASTNWFPVGGAQSPMYDLMSTSERFWNRAHHLVLPTIVLAASSLAGIMRYMRSNLLDTLRAEFVTTARAKGLSEGWVVYKHALRNAINPLLTIFGYSLAGLLSGAFIVENVMAWPGLGRLTIEAITAKDFELVVATVVMATVLLVIGNFIADVLLAWSDPRIRLK